ncbi:hypothetical protein H9P43_000916 [Blastocladiella emersonii ATCC 22665]|nr:hypothetical protein H9P43_000916 [Blastocladiella emersonii ATCC 22665]
MEPRFFRPAASGPRLDDDLAKALGGARPAGAGAEDYLSFTLACPARCAKRLATAVPAALAELAAGHVWARDALTIRADQVPAATPGDDDVTAVVVLVSGTLRVGECIDDEWFAVWALRALTARFAPDLAARVEDADGDPVLIEAADHLPRMATLDPDWDTAGRWTRAVLPLTRFLYAQLSATRVAPVPPAITRRFPAHVAAASPESAGTGEEREYHAGAKLALGLEMLARDAALAAAVLGETRAAEVPALVAAAIAAYDPAVAVPSDARQADDDAWMTLDEADLARWGVKSTEAKGGDGKEVDLAEITRSLNAFAAGESGVDGIAVGEEEDEDEEPPAKQAVPAPFAKGSRFAVPDDSSSDEDDDSDASSDDDEQPSLFSVAKFNALFEPKQQRPAAAVESNSDEEEEEDPLAAAFEEMLKQGDASGEGTEVGDEVESLKHLLSSLQSQDGAAGPGSSLLAHLGVPWIPGNSDGPAAAAAAFGGPDSDDE